MMEIENEEIETKKIEFENEIEVPYILEELNIIHLPMELILKIFSYLQPSDIESASLSCSRFFNASKYYKHMDQRVLCLEKLNFSDDEPPISSLMQTSRYFSSIVLYVVRFSDYNYFWLKFGSFVKSLTLKMCIIKKEKFLSILEFLPNLETLTIYDCNELVSRWPDEPLQDKDKPSLPKLKQIKLQKITLLKTQVFDYFLEMAPNLETLEISDCFKDCADSVARVKTVDHIVYSLAKKEKKLRKLDLLGTPIDDLSLMKLSEVSGLNLNYLGLTFTGRISNPGMLDLIKSQINITALNLSDSLNLLDYCLMLICSKMPNLRELKLKRCVMISDIGIRELVHLKKLIVLDITGCERITDKGLSDALVGKNWTQWKEHLQELHMGSISEITVEGLQTVATMFLDLTQLDLSSSGNCVTDYTMQLINKHLIKLRHLNLECCGKLSDAGISGQGFHDERLNRYYTFPISRLKGLRSLRLSGVYQLSDISLMCFDFQELKELTMARCQMITEQGVAHIARHCPSLEILDLTECQNINDLCVEWLTAYLQRLTSIRLICCNQLTDFSIDSILTNCLKLKTLHIRGCYQISYEALQSLNRLSSLRNIYTNFESVEDTILQR